jgi:hypothetical protein
MLYPVKALAAGTVVSRTILWGTQWGQLDGLREPVVAFAPGTCRLRHASASSYLVNCSALSLIWGSRRWSLTAIRRQDSYLVDSASSHMLVSKIKPCMSKYKQSIR